MSDENPRTRLYDAVSDTRQLDDHLEHAVLVSYVTVAEWMSPDGERWLSLVDGEANGDRLTSWRVQGMLFNVIHDPDWIHNGRDEDDDD